MLPPKLILIRHGESEGNLIVNNTRKDNDSLYNPKMKEAHTVSWRLSDKGIEQAQKTGEWLQNNTFLKKTNFVELYTSDYVRALETAYGLNIPKAMWQISSEVRERMYGDIDFLYTKDIFDTKFCANLAQRKSSNFHWVPQNGESISSVCERASNFIHRVLDGNIYNRKVVIVTHGEFIWAMRIVLGEILPREYESLRNTKPVYNCQITEFSNVSNDSYSRVRHYCPPTPDYHNWEYKGLKPKIYTNDNLKEIIDSYPRLITNPQ